MTENNCFLLNNVTKPILLSLCKKTKKKCLSKLKKKDLVVILSEYNAVIKIQRLCRRYLSNSKHLICPITMNNITYPVYPYRPVGHKYFIYYDLKSMHKYVETVTGDVYDPITRNIYTYNDMSKLCTLYKEYYKLNSVSIKKQQGIQQLQDELNGILIFLERYIDELVALIRDKMEGIANYSINHILKDLKFIIEKIYSISYIEGDRIISQIIDIISETYDRCIVNGENKKLKNIKNRVITEMITMYADNVCEIFFVGNV